MQSKPNIVNLELYTFCQLTEFVVVGKNYGNKGTAPRKLEDFFVKRAEFK